MELPVRIPHPGPDTCKVCGGRSEAAGAVDFAKNCEERRGVVLPRTEAPIHYHRCGDCSLLYTRAFDGWSHAEFRRWIYNDGYAAVDPDYVSVRPMANAATVAALMKRNGLTRTLDYGGGNGDLARALMARGFDAASWDPMEPGQTLPGQRDFQLVTAFEVMEHTPTPRATAREVTASAGARGVVLFSTLALDTAGPRAVDHWYVAPRNGHITIHTRASLQALFARLGWQVHHFGDAYHLAHRGNVRLA